MLPFAQGNSIMTILNADWPAYPTGVGVRDALVGLARFPEGTTFSVTSDIGGYVLLVADGFGRRPEDRLHLAIAHEALLDAADDGLVTGVERLTEREHEERRRDQLRAAVSASARAAGRPFPDDVDPLDHLGAVLEGAVVPFRLPPLDDEEDDDGFGPVFRTWLGVRDGERIGLTGRGWARLAELFEDEPVPLPDSARPRVEHIVAGGLYDTALRELGAMVETRMRQHLGSAKYGRQLGLEFVRSLEGEYLEAFVRSLRNAVLAAFAFIRNEYAHNLVDLPRPRAVVLLGLMSSLLVEVEAISSGARE
ncbi:hypothetical protein BJP25_24625 [Actinokineospora bangkokensis]|uniref:Uncharacterized protein n=1 Tax=Actinokineospora bangkokensis TaxID=1193682 RepID=A0A1Q9LJ43_9PSEU|nr:hypothetical protein BJP25_24625 [Actinokineospora bangkokensis]